MTDESKDIETTRPDEPDDKLEQAALELLAIAYDIAGPIPEHAEDATPPRKHAKKKRARMRKLNDMDIPEERFAFDGCHKIYLIATDEEAKDAIECDYEIRPITDLPACWVDTCPLRFVNRWGTFETVVGQFEPAHFEGWDVDETLARELEELAREQAEANEDD